MQPGEKRYGLYSWVSSRSNVWKVYITQDIYQKSKKQSRESLYIAPHHLEHSKEYLWSILQDMCDHVIPR